MKPSNFFHSKLNRMPDGVSPGAAPEPTPAEPVAPIPEPTADLSFIPSDYHTDGKPDVGKFTAHYQDLVARDAQAAERMGQVPEAYDFAIPEGLTFEGLDLPEGFKVELAKDDPALSPLYEELGGILKEVGAPAGSASKFASLIARYEAIKASQSYAAGKAEMQALGTPAQQEARLGAVQRVLETRLPADQAKAIMAATMTAAGVKALESLLRPAGHAAPPSAPARPDMEAMTPLERLKYANTHR